MKLQAKQAELDQAMSKDSDAAASSNAKLFIAVSLSSTRICVKLRQQCGSRIPIGSATLSECLQNL